MGNDVGILSFGAHIPRLRLQRKAIAAANAWFNPGLRSMARGERAMANWDEDAVTMAVEAARDVLIVAFVLVTMATDLLWRRIPDVLTYPVTVLGLAIGALEAFPGGIADRGFLDHLAGFVVAYAVIYPLYRMGGMKGGDAKLMRTIGALGGVRFFFYSFFYGALAGGVLALVLIALRRLDDHFDDVPSAALKSRRACVPVTVSFTAIRSHAPASTSSNVRCEYGSTL